MQGASQTAFTVCSHLRVPEARLSRISTEDTEGNENNEEEVLNRTFARLMGIFRFIFYKSLIINDSTVIFGFVVPISCLL
jgi:hypothetical protein